MELIVINALPVAMGLEVYQAGTPIIKYESAGVDRVSGAIIQACLDGCSSSRSVRVFHNIHLDVKC